MTRTITIDEAKAWIRSLPRKLVPQVLREAAGGVRYALQEHFKRRQAEPRKDGFPAQGFWVGSRDRGAGVPVNMQMQDTVFAADRAVISIDSPALAHKLDPSPPPIRPGAGKKYLTIPATAEAAGRSARDFPALVFEYVLPGGGSAPARGGGSGARPALVAKSSGKVYFWLARLVRTPHDPDALPSDERLVRAASDAARQAVSVLSP